MTDSGIASAVDFSRESVRRSLPWACRRVQLVAWTNYWHSFRKYKNVHSLYCAGSYLQSVADSTWEISPAITTISSQALFLPGQLERVTGMAYTDNPRRDMTGGIETVQTATRAFLLKNALLIDGAVYKRRKRFDLYARSRHSRLRRYFPPSLVDYEVDRAAFYSSYEGNEFFGMWLTDDLPCYYLSKHFGLPVTTSHVAFPHSLQYERWLAIEPRRLTSAYLREAVLFDDSGNTVDKVARARAVRDAILARVKRVPTPGVFILRRSSGVARVLHNELAIAEHLQVHCGFRVVDPTTEDVPDIVAACAGAKMVVGVEGSHLLHGVAVLPEGGGLLTLQPPSRFSGVIKRTTDQHRQRYGFVVGVPEGDGFRIDIAELERTLDLFSASTR
jgi:capsular polysaccharide biosynthesis protein